jgi:two-component system sensor histidine kinase HydH
MASPEPGSTHTPAQTAAAVERAAPIQRVDEKRRLEAIAEVSAGVAHELRNPLVGISSAAQLLRFRSTDDPVVEKSVGRILREVERLNRMVTSLLEFARPSLTVLVAGDPDAIWDDVLERERERIESRSLHVVRKRAKRHARVALDADRVAQLFINVLDNAVDASPDGAAIALGTELLDDGAWRCRLKNGGPALGSDQLSKVFEIIYTTKAGHTGIGLTLCQRIIEEHGGTIALESTADAGTMLTIVLPPHR